MSRYRYSQAGRKALKSAIAAAPGWSRYRAEQQCGGVSTLSVDELETAAQALGLDLRTFAAMVNDPQDTPQAAQAAPDGDDTPQDAQDAQDGDDTPQDAQDADPVAAAVRGVLSGGLDTLPDRVRALATRAQDAEAQAQAAEAKAAQAAALAMAAPAQAQDGQDTPQDAPAVASMFQAQIIRQDTAGSAFGLRHNALKGITVDVWDDPDAPAVDPHYAFDPDALADTLTMMQAGLYVWSGGPRGTGKTSFFQQIAARLGRGFVRINFDSAAEAPELVGQPRLRGGSTSWADGQLTAAMRRPGCVILLDEPSLARDSSLGILHPVLDSRVLSIRETGERVTCAPGVWFGAADNTQGHGDDSGLYASTVQQNAARMDRFAIQIAASWLPADKESRMLASRTGCNPMLADRLVELAGHTRNAEAAGELAAAMGPRRLIAMATMIAAGRPALRAWDVCVLTGASPDDRETLQQIASAHADFALIDMAAQGREPAPPPEPASTVQGQQAQADFDQVSEG